MKGDKKISILVIDDEPMILRVLHGILADEGYKVFVAKSGLKGLDILKKKNIDIVLLDVWMPEMGGLEALIKIKERHPDIKVVLMSGYGTKETAAKALQLGASDFITKPMSLESLLDSIQDVLEKESNRCQAYTVDNKAICITEVF
ncbi:MAG: response regulator [Pseudomonadota bacterium]